MIKVLGATVFGLLAVLGVGYLVVQKQEDQNLKNQVNTAMSNLGKNIRRGADNVVEFFKGDPTPASEPVEGAA